jgi:hypothetical protein
MAYNTIQPPFTLKFREMSRQELKDYFCWFLEMIPKRIDELAKAVAESAGFKTWQPDYTPNSLLSLGDWFAAHVETRPRTQQEVERIGSRSPYPIEIPGQELTNRTFSMAMDVGMYLSQVLLKNHPSLHWKQSFGSKHFIDYGQPVVVGTSPVPFNPVRMAVSFAYGLAGAKRSGSELREIYDIWLPKLVSARAVN